MEKINKIVKSHCDRLRNSNRTFGDIYEIMFSMKDRIIAETSSMMGIKEYTYGEVYEQIEKTAAAIYEETKVTDKYIGLYADNGVEWIVLFWAILRSGNKPYLINLRQPDKFTSSILSTLGAEYVIFVGKHKDFGIKALSYENLQMLSVDADNIKDVKFGNEIAITTSATTLKEKICIYKGENFAGQILNTEHIIRQNFLIKKHYKGRMKLLAFLPLYHIFGLEAVYFWFCFFGRTLVFLRDYAPETLLSTIRHHEVTHVFAVPILWHTIEKSVLREISGRDEKTKNKFHKGIALSVKLQRICPKLGKYVAKKMFKEVRDSLFGDSVLFCISGGSYIKPSALEMINAIGYPLHNGYGMSEIGITSVELGRNIKDRLKNSIGKPFESVQYKIDEKSSTLLVKGQSLCNMIIADGEQEVPEEWFSTGDIVTVDNDGRYYISGRRSDVVMGDNGENLNPDFAEKAFAFTYAKNFCVMGNKEKDKLVLIVQIENNLVDLQKDKLLTEIEAGNTSLPMAYRVKEVYFTYNPIQSEKAIKVSRAYVERGIENGSIVLFKDINESNDNAETEETELKAVIRAIVAKAIGLEPGDVSDKAHFFSDLGGSSLDYFATVCEINNKFGISLMFEDENYAYCVEDLERIVKEYLCK